MTEHQEVDIDEAKQFELGVHLSITRVKNHLARYSINKVFEDQILALKDVAGSEEKVAALKSAKMRMSATTALRLTLVLERLTTELISEAFKVAIADSGRKTVNASDVIRGLDHASLAPLVVSLPVLKTVEKYIKKDKDAAEETAEETPAEAEAEESGKTRFNSYINKIKNDVKSSVEAFSTMRVATNVAEFLNEILTSVISRYAGKLQLLVQSAGIKTIYPENVDTATIMMLHDGEEPAESIDYTTVKKKVKEGEKEVETEHLVATVKVDYESKRFANLAVYLDEKSSKFAEILDLKVEYKKDGKDIPSVPKPAPKAKPEKVATAPKAAAAPKKEAAPKAAKKEAEPKAAAPAKKETAPKAAAAPKKEAAAPKAVAEKSPAKKEAAPKKEAAEPKAAAPAKKETAPKKEAAAAPKAAAPAAAKPSAPKQQKAAVQVAKV